MHTIDNANFLPLRLLHGIHILLYVNNNVNNKEVFLERECMKYNLNCFIRNYVTVTVKVPLIVKHHE